MPYIPRDRREKLALAELPQNAGELNYLLTQTIRRYWLQHPNYQGINDILGALEGAKSEFCRRVVGDYEDKKIRENGDVYL